MMYNTTYNVNVPPVLEPYSITNAGKQFWTMPVPTVDETKELLDAYFETFHMMQTSGLGQYNFAFDYLVVPYFFFFSNCYGYDSYIPIWMITEDPLVCKLSKQLPRKDGRRKYDALPDQDSTRFIGPYDLLVPPIADTCKVSSYSKFFNCSHIFSVSD